MSRSDQFFSVAEAASRLGVSAKALRLYEQRGLVAPIRSRAGWRAYGPRDLARAGEVVALRALGFSLAQVACLLKGDAGGLEPALALHQATLDGRLRQLAGTIEKVRRFRDDLARGGAATAGDPASPASPNAGPCIAFDLPWPWGGERFALGPIRPLNYVIGPLGSGKTRLAKRLAETVPGAAFVGLDRLANGGAASRARLDADPVLKARIDQIMARLVADGAAASHALVTLLADLESTGPAIRIVDLVEEGLDHATQTALIACLRRRGQAGPPLFLLTRSSAILDLAGVGPDEAIIFCPANHSPPTYVTPCPGVPGYEAVATCLASPEVRARTAGAVAWRPNAA